MIKPEDFYNVLVENGIDFFAGVPDSLLKDICAYITDNTSDDKNIITANEGGAIALASGHYLASGNIPLVYMQNSGIGNAINPLLSLTDLKVYSIPMLLMIGWRSEPGIKDEPQHVRQGEVTLELLDVLGIQYKILPTNILEAVKLVLDLIKKAVKTNQPVALVIKKNTFESYKLSRSYTTDYELNREDAIKILVDLIEPEDVVISTTGKTSRELFEYREYLGQGHEKDFLTVGSMGHASQIALGIALNKKNINVYCFDGDGSVLMHTGSMGIIGKLAPKNFRHILINNGAHDSVGGQPTIGFNVDFQSIAKSFNYQNTFFATDKSSVENSLKAIKSLNGPILLEIRVNKGGRKELGRPTLSPIENKNNFMSFLK